MKEKKSYLLVLGIANIVAILLYLVGLLNFQAVILAQMLSAILYTVGGFMNNKYIILGGCGVNLLVVVFYITKILEYQSIADFVNELFFNFKFMIKYSEMSYIVLYLVCSIGFVYSLILNLPSLSSVKSDIRKIIIGFAAVISLGILVIGLIIAFNIKMGVGIPVIANGARSLAVTISAVAVTITTALSIEEK